ncbi:GDSL lipase/acylhydrolase family protein [Geopyxis carbonaria]|nr:GDSL lipase/acylhydrolase family protein [Geopyxis carbonaria]
MKFSTLLPLALSLASSTSAAAAGWGGRTKNLITFGDSYTDESRLSYFFEHKGEAPPAGWVGPFSAKTASGGLSWARYAANSTKTTLYNYAVSGAVCSNELTPRYLAGINGNFPDVLDYELGAFTQDITPLKINIKDSIVSIWIGTNDLGGDALISHSTPATKITDFTRCVFQVLKGAYDLGARRFVLQNIAPLEVSPLYTTVELGGSGGPNRFWRGRPENATETMVRMRDQVAAVNEIWKYQAAAAVHGELKGAKLAVLDSYTLMSEIYHNPAAYLNGSQPLNVTGFNEHCDLDGNCTEYRMDDRDSFFWYDELHPSEQVGRIVAKEFVDTIKGKGKYASYFG